MRRRKRLKRQRLAWENDLLPAYEAGELAWHLPAAHAAPRANGAKLTIYNDEPVESTSMMARLHLRAQAGQWPGRGDGLIPTTKPTPSRSIPARPVDGARPRRRAGRKPAGHAHIARGADRFVLTEVEAEVAEQAEPRASCPSCWPSGDIGDHAEIPADGRHRWRSRKPVGASRSTENPSPLLALRFAEPLRTRRRYRDDGPPAPRFRPRRATIGRFRLALSAATYSWPEMANPTPRRRRVRPITGADLNASRAGHADCRPTVAKDPAQERGRAQRRSKRTRLLDYLRILRRRSLQPLTFAWPSCEAERDLLKAAIPRVVVTEATTPAETRILPRGNWMDDSGDVVQPAIPSFSANSNTGGRRATRLDLANWLVSPENPLTARVFVNRLWRQFFGTGISKILEDLGSQGEWPVASRIAGLAGGRVHEPAWHAEGAHPWDVRHMIRTIVTSHTYRQSSMTDAAARRARSGQPSARASEPLPRGCRRCARYRALGFRPAGRKIRRAQRAPVPARRLSGRVEFSQARIVGQPRRRSLPPRRLHPLAAHLPASDAAEFRRAHARGMHRQSHEFQHAAAGAGSAERSDLRRERRAYSRENILKEGGPRIQPADGLGLSSAPWTARPTTKSGKSWWICIARTWTRFRARPNRPRELMQRSANRRVPRRANRRARGHDHRGPSDSEFARNDHEELNELHDAGSDNCRTLHAAHVPGNGVAGSGSWR